MRDAGPGRGEQADLVLVEHDAVGGDHVGPEEIVRPPTDASRSCRRSNEQILVRAPGACSGEQVRDLGRTLGDVRCDRQAQLGAGFVKLDRDRVGSMGRDTGPHPRRERVADAIADPGEVLERLRRIGAEDLEVDGGAQTELRTGHRSGAAVAAVADGRHA